MRTHRLLGTALALLAAGAPGMVGADETVPAPAFDPVQSLLGAWSWRNGCSRPDFIFRSNALDFAFDADGTPGKHHFAPVSYRQQTADEVIVHLSEPHGLSGTPKPDELDVRLLDFSKALILRHGKKHGLDMELRKCPIVSGEKVPVH